MTLEAVPTCVVVEASDSDDETVLVMRVCGELDMDSRTSIEPAIMAAVMMAGSVILDLAELTFCDSGGLRTFITVKQRAEAESTALKLRNVTPAVARLLKISGFDQVLDITN